MLPDSLRCDALTDAMAEPDPDALAAGTRMRRRYAPETAAAALQQASLRRQAQAKFGDSATGMFFTADGLEQATRPEIAAHHAARFLAAAARRVVDLGCGIGSDAVAFARAGLAVTAVDRDTRTAQVAEANLSRIDGSGVPAEVLIGDARRLAGELLTETDAVFLDPSRRTAAGRTWHTSDVSPPWNLVLELLDGKRIAGVKLGPGLPHTAIPPGVEAEWISHRGETVEAALWAGPDAVPDRRTALIMPNHHLIADPRAGIGVAPLADYIYEPAGAVIRAGGIATLARDIGAWLLDDQIAYLSSGQATTSPYATGFWISEVLPYQEKTLRAWIRTRGIGRLEIKKRGIDVDPAALRKRLRPSGDAAATMIIARTPAGTKALICQRLPDR